MQYLGGLRGIGMLTCGHEALAEADYDFDGYLTNRGEVTSCGEIRMCPQRLREIFGRNDLTLRTADGRLLRLRFSEKKLATASCAAHVEVAGDLPSASEWCH